jgi:hypothetical protein
LDLKESHVILDDALEFETAIVGSAVVESQDNITELKLKLTFTEKVLVVHLNFEKKG